MATDNLSFYGFIISLISLGVSLVLGWLKIKEYRRDNRHVHVTWSLNGNEEIGDHIYLTNLSSTPILVDYWQIGWVKRFGIGKKFQPIDLFADEDLHMTLEPRKRSAINFKDQYTFNWFPKNKRKMKLYIYLDIAGRKKPLRLFVFDPNHP
ncbi:hypothetical protein HDF19_00695 [Mucilaginibacter sp. E4BP6]|uniref:hypothetical protein n=1 Tax=Mucilaginibacter sp. E4BP6 TaxID=2723089 RepID=UPI0015CE0EFB|nr:hypothetical protein [Mucilaginibacter sp. E4BP6]NYE66903.1 hypothetical protein [Mucilaginibacter sp. E4BP6]